jgi:rhodanese-related sulfurtransferase
MNFIKTPQELKQILDTNNSNLVLLDVRTPAEFNSGHLKGAINIDVTSPDFSAKISQLDSNKEYIVYCRSGGRSMSAYQQMTAMGFKTSNCLFGMMSVDGSGLEVE